MIFRLFLSYAVYAVNLGAGDATGCGGGVGVEEAVSKREATGWKAAGVCVGTEAGVVVDGESKRPRISSMALLCVFPGAAEEVEEPPAFRPNMVAMSF